MIQKMNRGTQSDPARCDCSICKRYDWSHLPWWVHTPFEVFRILHDGRIYFFSRAEFKRFLAAGARLATIKEYVPGTGRTRMLDQVQGGYLDWETYWTLDVIEPKAPGFPEFRVRSLKEMEEEEQMGMNYSFDDEADGIFPIEFRKRGSVDPLGERSSGRLLTKNGIWIK